MAPLVEHQYARGRVWHRWDSSETVYGPITQLENQPPRRVGHPHARSYIKKYLTCLVSTRDNSVRCTRRGQRLSSSRSSYVLLAYRRTRSQALITHHAKRPVRGVFYGSRLDVCRTYSAKPGSLQALGGRSSVSTSRSCSTKSCS